MIEEPAEAVAMMAEASKIKTEDVEKSYDFFVKGKFFEPHRRRPHGRS